MEQITSSHSDHTEDSVREHPALSNEVDLVSKVPEVSDEQILENAIKWINTSGPFHHAEDEYGGSL